MELIWDKYRDFITLISILQKERTKYSLSKKTGKKGLMYPFSTRREKCPKRTNGAGLGAEKKIIFYKREKYAHTSYNLFLSYSHN
jgi:hypothetical protein